LEVCIQGDLNAFTYGQARRAVETKFFGLRDVLGGFEELWNMWLRARRIIGGLLRGCSPGGDGGHEKFHNL
jgi:hypothetical protein